MSDNISILLQISILLGVSINENELNNIDNECDQIKYLLNQIYFYLGG